MSGDVKLMADFEAAVQAQVDQLEKIAKDMGDKAVHMKEQNPELDIWNTPQAKMQHCINGTLQVIMYVGMAGFDIASRSLDGYIPRIEAIEEKVDCKQKPSDIVREIKKHVDLAHGLNL